MARDKLETAKASAAYLARRLAPTDRLAVVTYDDEVRLELPLTEVGHDQQYVEETLHRIRPGGMTNLSGGWLKGVEQLRAVPGGIGPKKVLLLTDGLANRGVTDPDPRLRWRGARATRTSAPRRSASARASTRSS
jgi:Ca-activated chloride channel family protein